MEFLGLIIPFAGSLTLLVLLAKLIAGKADANRKATAAGAGDLEFAPNRRGFWGAYGFIGLFGLMAITSVVNALRAGTSMLFAVIAVGFVVLLLSAFPATIVMNKQGLEQVFWLRSRKRIAWKDVVDVDADEKKGEVRITGRSGVKIVHTRQLPDKATFVAELEKHRSESVTVPEAAPMLAVSGPAA